MPQQIKIWEINLKSIIPVNDVSLSSFHVESELENWIVQKPGILGDDLLIIDRQREIDGVGRLDLLCIDASEKLVIVELKRDLLTRDAVAQALDYASWLDSVSEDQIYGFAEEFLHKSLDDVYREHFGQDLDSLVCQNHRVLIVGARLDPASERIVNYLSERHGIDINAIFFKYAQLGDGKEILVRSVLVPDESRKIRAGRGWQPTLEELLQMSETHKTQRLVDVCREMRKQSWDETPRNTYGGSLRYWARTAFGKTKMVFGVNIAGERLHAPDGQLDVWIPPASLAEIAHASKEEIRQTLESKPYKENSQPTDCILRLQNEEQARDLVKQLTEWVSPK